MRVYCIVLAVFSVCIVCDLSVFCSTPGVRMTQSPIVPLACHSNTEEPSEDISEQQNVEEFYKRKMMFTEDISYCNYILRPEHQVLYIQSVDGSYDFQINDVPRRVGVP